MKLCAVGICNAIFGSEVKFLDTVFCCLWMAVNYLRCHFRSYVPQANSSNPSVVNCSLIENYVCGDARRRASESTGISYSIDTCSSVCCTEKSCNVHPTDPPPDNKANGDSSTAASTTVNGVNEVQAPCLGLLLVMLAISVAMKKVDEYF